MEVENYHLANKLLQTRIINGFLKISGQKYQYNEKQNTFIVSKYLTTRCLLIAKGKIVNSGEEKTDKHDLNQAINVNITSNGKSLIHVPLDATLRKTHHNFSGKLNQEETLRDTHKLRDSLQK